MGKYSALSLIQVPRREPGRDESYADSRLVGPFSGWEEYVIGRMFAGEGYAVMEMGMSMGRTGRLLVGDGKGNGDGEGIYNSPSTPNDRRNSKIQPPQRRRTTKPQELPTTTS